MEKQKFNRVASDPSQLQKFVNEVIEGGSESGGTKLYKHVTTIQVTDNLSGESFLAKIIFILTSDKSLKGTRIETPLKRGYISGYITLGSAAAILLGIPTWYQEEEKFIYADWDGSLTYLKPSDGYEYLSDDVTEL